MITALMRGFLVYLEVITVLSITQDDIDYMGTFLDVRIDVLDHLIDEKVHFKAQLALTNTGTRAIRADDWEIYFCIIRHIDRPRIDQPGEYDYLQYGVNITHINGCLHRIHPSGTFKDIPPDGNMKVIFLVRKWHVARTDWMPNWYVTSNGLEPRTMVSTAGESLSFVGEYDSVNKWKRYSVDQYDPYTLGQRYAINVISDLQGAPNLLLPTPVQMEVIESEKILIATWDWVVVLENANQLLSSAAQFLFGKTGIPVTTEIPKIRYIRLVVGNPEVRVNGSPVNSAESYELQVDGRRQCVTITASTTVGAFYGVQSLLALLNEDWKIPVVTIKDAPRFEYRGMHLDVGRNFHRKEYVLKLLDIMAMYKLNKFHFHLADDEGWRLEIPGLPELTEVGGKRCHDLEEQSCMLSQLGSGPTTQSVGTGFYTVMEYQDILRHAAVRHIEVIPEFDSPGHAHAAIAAMRKRNNDLRNRGDVSGAKEFFLTDPDDTSLYDSIQMFDDNAINPCLQSTKTFFSHVIATLVDIHKDINPLKIFHFGGDEVAKGAWVNSTVCKDLTERSESLQDAEDLKEYFVRIISNITARHGLNFGAWEDGLMGRDKTPYDISQLQNKHVYAYAWDNVWEYGVANRAYKLANANFKVVMSHATHLYFDHPYEPDPEERGYYWAARFTNTRKTFGYMPDNIYANADVTRAGEPITEQDICEEINGTNLCDSLLKSENIAGIQGQLWSETVRTPGQADSMIFPRVLALAERAWHKAEWESEMDTENRNRKLTRAWESFANTLGYRELKRLDKLGVAYRVSQPGAKLVDGKLVTNSAFPGLTVEYSTDDGVTWCSKAGVPVTGKVLFRTRSADGGRTSRTEKMIFPITASLSSALIPNMMVLFTVFLLTTTTRHWQS